MTETTAYADLDLFDVEVDGFVATVRMNRPPVNAQSFAFREQCIATFDRLSDDSAVRAVVFTGNGTMFSAGADLRDRPDPGVPGDYRRHNRVTRDCFDAVLHCAKPIIAAIDGPAIAAGFVLASVCDILVAADEAWISMPEVSVGLAGGVRHVLRHFSASDARLAMFTGRRFSGQELLRMGVVSRSVPRAELLAVAGEIAGEIVANAPLAVSAAKRSFLVGEELSVHTGYGFEQSQTASLATSEDFHEARTAFEERRPPRFSGR